MGSLIFGVTTALSFKVHRRIEEDLETTLEMFFLRSEIRKSLKALLFAVLIFGVSGIFSIVGMRFEIPVLTQSILLGSIVLFTAYMGFFVTLYLSTNPENDFREIVPWGEKVMAKMQ
ncbi:hypothetical protein AQV86_03505 [Nanohaloarchaea archaeon SG9]|nr:hypothetical protein AQV86_03505 [Nanohaloarchaea archaeon SG9]